MYDIQWITGWFKFAFDSLGTVKSVFACSNSSSFTWDGQYGGNPKMDDIIKSEGKTVFTIAGDTAFEQWKCNWSEIHDQIRPCFSA